MLWFECSLTIVNGPVSTVANLSWDGGFAEFGSAAVRDEMLQCQSHVTS